MKPCCCSFQSDPTANFSHSRAGEPSDLILPLNLITSHTFQPASASLTRTTMESEITEDLIVEILLRLPIKKIVQLKSVSKQWLELISRDTFAFQLSQFQTSSLFFVLRVMCSRSFIVPVSYDGENLNKHPNIDLPHMGESDAEHTRIGHDLIPAGYGVYIVFDYLTDNAMLWNPTTKKTRVLPPSPFYPSLGHVYHFGAMDYKDGNFTYKVGRVASRTIKHIERDRKLSLCSFSLELYSSKTKSWKFIPDFASGQYIGYVDCIMHCVNLNGRVHWVIRSHTEDTCVTTFDYDTEVFGSIKAPSPLEVGDRYNKRHCILTSFDDKFLCLVLLRDINDETRYLDIWVMREYEVEDSWTKEFTVGPVAKDMEVLGFSSKLQGVFLWRPNGYRTRLLLLECKSSEMKTCRMIGRKEERRKEEDQCMQVMEHVESLVPLLE